MLTRPVVATVLVLLTSTAMAADDTVHPDTFAPVALSIAEAREDVALMRRALETIHPGLYRYRSRREIDAAFQALEEAASEPLTDLGLWREISLMLAKIHCDHTKAEPSNAIESYRETHPTHLPLRFKIIEGRMIVISNDGQAGAPPVGAEITAINGNPVPVALAQLGHAVAYDGSTEQAIAAKLESDGDLMGDDFNEYWPVFYGFAQKWKLEWKRAADRQLESAVLQPINFKSWTELRWPGSRFRDEFYKAVGWRIAGKTAYLRVDTFVNYRNPVEPTSFLGGFFKVLANTQVEHLILDLRENGGGSEDVSLALGRYLLAERFTWSRPALLKAIRYGDLPNYMETWGDARQLFEPPIDGFRRTEEGWWERLPRAGDEDDDGALAQEVSADRFKGRVSIITGPRNRSGATRTIAQLQERIGARLVGEDSAGSAEGPTAGHIFLLTLPNSGIKIRIPNAWNRTNITQFESGGGVAVHEFVMPTLIDFQNDRDRALEIAKQPKPPVALSLADLLSGEWEGTLEYRDFQSDHRVILPLKMSGKPRGANAQLFYTIEDGPAKTVHSTEYWHVSVDGKTLSIGEGKNLQNMTILEHRADKNVADVTLVAQGMGEENQARVMIRTVITRRGGELSISRLSKKAGEPFFLRHCYRLTRR